MKILFFAANPQGTQQLQLDEEARAIAMRLKGSRLRDQFQLITKWAVSPDDLREALLEEEKENVIVHFSGHGEGQQGLVLVEQGKPKPVTADALSDLFFYFRSTVKCVLLNACYAEVQAKAIVKHIDYVIGMKEAVQDDAAIKFAAAFYQVLGYGRPIEDAFGLGCNAIWINDGNFTAASRKLVPVGFEGAEETAKKLESHRIPVLLKKDGLVDPNSVQPGLTAERVKDKSISKEDALKQFRAEVRTTLDTKALTNTKWIQLGTSATVLGVTEEEANQILEEEQKRLEQLAEESESVKQYRAIVKKHLSDHQLTAYEKIQIKNDGKELELSEENANRILEEEKVEHYRVLVKEYVADPERRPPGWKAELETIQQAIDLSNECAQEVLEIELASIEKAQQNYGSFLQDLIQGGLYPFNTEAKEGLQRKQQEKKLTEEEVKQVSAPILERAEEAYQQQQRQHYEQAFRSAIEATYPLSVALRDGLKTRQQALGLSDEVVEQIEQPLIAPKKAEYQEKLQRYEQEVCQAVEAGYPLGEDVRNQLAALQQSLVLQAEDTTRIEQPILAAADAVYQKQRRQEEAQIRQREHENNLQHYEQAFRSAVDAAYPLSEAVRDQLKNRQQELGLSEEEVAEIANLILAAAEEAHRQKLQRYEQEFRTAIAAQYPIDSFVRDGLNQFQQSLKLSDEDAARIEAPLITPKEAAYRQQLADERRKKEEPERQRLEEEQRKKEKAERQLELEKQQKLEQQRQERLKQEAAAKQRQAEEQERQRREAEALKQKQAEVEKLRQEELERQRREVASEKGIDYTRLRDLLQEGKWKDADHETYLRMLEAVGRKDGDYCRAEEFQKIPCADLQTIDRLWVKYSNGHFGFSVQKQIWQECSSPTPPLKNWDRFFLTLGWSKEKPLKLDHALERSKLKFNLKESPRGELPIEICVGKNFLNHRIWFPHFYDIRAKEARTPGKYETNQQRESVVIYHLLSRRDL